MPAGNINDAQPAVSETDVRSQVNAGIIWTAVRQRVVHALEESRGNRLGPVKVNDPAYATHHYSLNFVPLEKA
jgi:hypothetical protein